MDARLAGRAALVTGAGRGIGAAVAERLAADGARVAVNDIAPEPAEATAERIRAAGGEAFAVAADVADPAAARDAVGTVVGAFGGLGILVNNAGTLLRAPVREHTPHEWRRVLDVNLGGPFFLAQAAAGHLAASGHGAIVNVCSVAVTGFSGQVSYDASKGGLLTLTRSLAVELGREAVRANAVAPGFIDTDLARTGDLARIGARTVARLPIARLGRPEEVAATVAWLASDEAGYVTGQVIFVDGGWVRQ